MQPKSVKAHLTKNNANLKKYHKKNSLQARKFIKSFLKINGEFQQSKNVKSFTIFSQ